MFGLVQSSALACDEIPAAAWAPPIDGMKPDPLSPGQRDAVGDFAMKVFGPFRMIGPRQTATLPGGSGAVWLMLAMMPACPTAAAATGRAAIWRNGSEGNGEESRTSARSASGLPVL